MFGRERGRDDSDSDDDLNTDWIQNVETLCTTKHEYLPIPSIRLVVILPSGEYEIKIIGRSDFVKSGRKEPVVFDLNLQFPGTLIRDISLFAFDIPKQKLSVGVACSYISIHSMDELRERLVALHAFPCFFDLFEILVILDNKPISAIKDQDHPSNGRAFVKKNKTRKTVRFHHSCTRRA